MSSHSCSGRLHVSGGMVGQHSITYRSVQMTILLGLRIHVEDEAFTCSQIAWPAFARLHNSVAMCA
jgi:hypothetical protein